MLIWDPQMAGFRRLCLGLKCPHGGFPPYVVRQQMSVCQTPGIISLLRVGRNASGTCCWFSRYSEGLLLLLLVFRFDDCNVPSGAVRQSPAGEEVHLDHCCRRMNSDRWSLPAADDAEALTVWHQPSCTHRRGGGPALWLTRLDDVLNAVYTQQSSKRREMSR